MNESLSHPEQIRSYRVIDKPLSISEGELTPNLKVKRANVEKHLADVIEEKLNLVPCRVKVDHLVIASVSNWGAYGITAYLEKLTEEKVFPGLDEVEGYLSRTILLGSVDGVLRQNVCSVDGYPLAESERVYRLLQQAVTV